MSSVHGSTTLTDMCVGTYNDATGCEVWLLKGGTWSRIGSDGFGSASNFCAYSIYMNTSQGARKIRVATGGGIPGGAESGTTTGGSSSAAESRDMVSG